MSAQLLHLSFLVCLLAAGCAPIEEPDLGTSETVDIYEAFCAKADECNMLSGMSASECEGSYREAVESCTGTEEEDWGTDQAACLDEFTTCDDWAGDYGCVYDSYTWGCWE